MDRKAYNEMHDYEDSHWWFVSRRSIIKKVLDHYLPSKQARKVLEVGCGTGGNLQMLSNFGEISAMELDDDVRQKANNRKICSVKAGKLPDNIPFEREFDLVCLLDVIEHVDEDLASLKNLRVRLNPGGKILITVPAYQFLWSAHDVANHHKRRYTRKHLKDVVTEAGFTIKYATYYNTLLFPIILAVRILNNLLNKKVESDVEMPSPFANQILKKIFSSERVIIPSFSLPFGVSILLIAETEK